MNSLGEADFGTGEMYPMKQKAILTFRRFVRDELGATAIEYGLLAALLGVALVTAMSGLGNQMKTTFNTTSSSMSSANAAA